VKKEPKMPDDTKKRGSATGADDSALSRRNILLGTSTLVAVATLTSGALAQAEKPRRALLRLRLRPAASPTSSLSGATIVWSRDEVTRIDDEDFRVFGPGSTDSLEGRFPS
jgi:hypothetical protein